MLKIEEIVKDDNVFFVVMGIIIGDLFKGVYCKGSMLFIEMLLICGCFYIIWWVELLYDVLCMDD